jgi:hypothetical protein
MNYKKWLFRFTLVFFTIIGSLFLVEILFRIIMPPPSNVIVYSKPQTPIADDDSIETQQLNLKQCVDEGGLFTNTEYGRRLNPNMDVF